MFWEILFKVLCYVVMFFCCHHLIKIRSSPGSCICHTLIIHRNPLQLEIWNSNFFFSMTSQVPDTRLPQKIQRSRGDGLISWCHGRSVKLDRSTTPPAVRLIHPPIQFHLPPRGEGASSWASGSSNLSRDKVMSFLTSLWASWLLHGLELMDCPIYTTDHCLAVVIYTCDLYVTSTSPLGFVHFPHLLCGS